MRQARNQANLLHGVPSSNRRPNGGDKPNTLHIKNNIKEWEECLPIAEYAYNRARHSTTGKSPFKVVYGFNPLSPLDILPLPLQGRTNLDASARASYIKKMHEDTRHTIERQATHDQAQHQQATHDIQHWRSRVATPSQGPLPQRTQVLAKV